MLRLSLLWMTSQTRPGSHALIVKRWMSMGGVTPGPGAGACARGPACSPQISREGFKFEVKVTFQ